MLHWFRRCPCERKMKKFERQMTKMKADLDLEITEAIELRGDMANGLRRLANRQRDVKRTLADVQEAARVRKLEAPAAEDGGEDVGAVHVPPAAAERQPVSRLEQKAALARLHRGG